MAETEMKLEPGVILNEVVSGCLRAAGTNLYAWCRENDVNHATAKQALFGQSGGDRGKELLSKMIETAGRTQVEMTYRKRIEDHAAAISGEAA